MRSAAAFAAGELEWADRRFKADAAADKAGNVAVGSTGHFLPLLLKHIDSASSETVRILLLHALKEVSLLAIKSAERFQGDGDDARQS